MLLTPLKAAFAAALVMSLGRAAGPQAVQLSPVETEAIGRVARQFVDAAVTGNEQEAMRLCASGNESRDIMLAVFKTMAGDKTLGPTIEVKVFLTKARGKNAVAYVQSGHAGPTSIERNTGNARRSFFAGFVQEEGGWKWRVAEDAIVSCRWLLLTAKTKEDRRQILTDYQPLLDTDLPTRMRRDVSALIDAKQFKDATIVSDLALEVAEFMKSDYERAYGHMNRAMLLRARARSDRSGLKPREYPDFTPALRELGVALKCFDARGDAEGLSKVHYRAGKIQELMARFDSAVDQFNKAISCSRQAMDRGLEADALIALGAVLINCGRHAESLTASNKALSLYRAGKNRIGEANSLANIGNALEDMGRYGDAMTRFDAARSIYSDLHDRKGLGDILNSIGCVHSSLGRERTAVECFEGSLKIAREIKDRSGEMIALHNLAGSYATLRRFDEAMDAEHRSADIAAELGDERYGAQSWALLADIALKAGLLVEARVSMSQRLTAARNNGDRRQEAYALIDLGRLCIRQKQYRDAMDYLSQSLKIGEKLHQPLMLVNIWREFGILFFRQGQWGRSADTFGKAIRNAEQLRYEGREQSLKRNVLAYYSDAYLGLVEALVNNRRIPEAFAVSEMAKARGLDDMMRGGHVNVAKQMTQSEVEAESAIESDLRQISTKIEHTYNTDDLEILASQRAKRQKDLDALKIALYLRHPELKTSRADFAPASIEQIDGGILKRFPDSAILSYAFGQNRVMLFVIVRDKHGMAALTFHSIAIPNSAMRDRIQNFMLECSTAGKDWKTGAVALYRDLIAPAERELAGKKSLIIIAEEMLSAIPFSALMDRSGKPLIHRFAVSVAPSVTALISMMAPGKKHPQKNTMVVSGAAEYGPGLSPLKAAGLEIQEIGRMFGKSATVCTGRAATETKVRVLLSRGRFLHFATHGVLNETAPMYSAIAFTADAKNDGMLEARELCDLNISADVVVLSACETARGRSIRGEGVLGLTWALFVAGARSTIASHWQVDDESTRILMTQFYRPLIGPRKSRVNRSEALRQAQLTLMKNPKYSHPYYWAPFVLSGAW
jgi:CHAT domain-containing protein/tetratricopeptide (TPR) repeat protein